MHYSVKIYNGKNIPAKQVMKCLWHVASLQVKILGVLGLIDGGETDWKLIAIDVKDSDAAKINSLIDVEKNKPGLLNATVEWFRNYKIPEGKPKNMFAFNGELKDSKFAETVVQEVHEHWKHLMIGDEPQHDIERSCTKCGYDTKILSEEIENIIAKEPALNLRVSPPSTSTVVHYCD